MFPRHVRWCRLLLFVLVLIAVNSDKAIAKTEGNLNLDSGQVIVVTCPAESTVTLPCGDNVPEIPAEFLNSISDGDAAAFQSLGGSISGPIEGQLIILGLELSSGVNGNCEFGVHHFIIYDDVNMNNTLEGNEFSESCTIIYEAGTPMGPSVDCSGIEDITIDCSTFIPTGTTLTEFIDGELTITEQGLLTSTTGSGTITISNNFLFTGSGMNTDIIYTGYTGSGMNMDDIFITGSGSSQDIIFTVSDMNGEIGTCTQMITLDLDDSELEISCSAETVSIMNGTASIEATSMATVVSDECNSSGPYTYEIACESTGPCGNPNDTQFASSKDFCCAQVGSTVNVILRVTDINGNTATCASTVIVNGENNNNDVDLAIECESQNVMLLTGSGTIDAGLFVTNITDACGSSGPYTFQVAYESSGPCGNPNDIVFSPTQSFCCDQTGSSVNVIVMVTDNNGNTATCSSTVAVTSENNNNMDMAIECEAQDVMLVNGSGSVSAEDFVTNITDACGSSGPYTYEVAYETSGACGNPNDVTFSTSQDFCCAQTGSSVNVIVRVTDNNGNSATCSSTVDVTSENENPDPIIECEGQNVMLVNGAGSVDAANFVTNITDACDGSAPYTYEIAYEAAGPCENPNDIIFSTSQSFCCAQTGSSVNVIVRVTDNNGNSTTCSSTVDVTSENNNNLELAIACEGQDVMIVNGTGSIGGAGFVTDITDACGSSGPYAYEIAYAAAGMCGGPNELTFSPTQSFCCEQVGSQVDVIIRVTDTNGNSTTCTSTVTVEAANNTNNATLGVVCQEQSISLDDNGNGSIQAISLVDEVLETCSTNGPLVYEIAYVAAGPCNNPKDLLFETAKPFCCEQAGSSVAVILRVTDADGNTAECTTNVIVEPDTDSFAIVCNGSQQVILEDNGIGVVAPENFVVEIIDNCGSSGPYTYEIAKMVAGPCNMPNDIVYEPSKAFCCEEVGNVTVFVRVTDINGSASTCMTTVQVLDLSAPTIASCPADLTAHCSTPIDLDDLSQFGVPTALDNCDVELEETYQDLREDCGLGDIIRTFTFTDDSDNEVSCTQTVTLYNNDTFDESNIVWPADNTYTNLCDGDVPSPDVAGTPTYTTLPCSSPLVTHTDDVSNIGPGCFVVNRTWVVIDWCQFDNDAPIETYRWEHTQVLTVEDNIAPTLTCEAEVESCGNELTCTGYINYTVEATDDCANADDLLYVYTLTLEDGTVFNGTGNTINDSHPYGTHNLLWSVTDQCGNVSTCAQTMIIRDCKPPQAVCLSGVSINLTQIPGMEPEAVIWASDINASSYDNCTPTEDLEYAFNTDFTELSKTFDCGDLGNQNIILYVRDADGNIGQCKSTIQVQDNFNYCDNFTDPDGEVMIAGSVMTQSDIPMEEVHMLLDNATEPTFFITDENGYAFEDLAMYENYKVVPTFDDEALNGVSTADIVEIQRHILGLSDLDSPYKIIAADVNNSESITASDIIEIRKVILGVQEEFPNTKVWRFVDSGYQFADPESPFPYYQSAYLTQLDHDATNTNFVGIKSGDVNHSALINGFIPEILSFRSPQTLSLVSSSLERGSVQLTVNDEQELSGFQLAFRSSGSLDQFSISSDLIEIDESNYAVHDDIVKISWSSAQAITVEEGEVLLSLNYDGDNDFQLLNDLPMFESEAYNASINSMDVEIHTETKLLNNEWQVYRNTPNPFVDFTYIPFTAPTKASLTLSVFDVNGTLLHSDTKIVEQGFQKWEVSATDLGNVHGVLYYRLESEDFSSTQPFIRLK